MRLDTWSWRRPIVAVVLRRARNASGRADQRRYSAARAQDVALPAVRRALQRSLEREPLHVFHLVVSVVRIATGGPHQEEMDGLADPHVFPHVEVAGLAERRFDLGFDPRSSRTSRTAACSADSSASIPPFARPQADPRVGSGAPPGPPRRRPPAGGTRRRRRTPPSGWAIGASASVRRSLFFFDPSGSRAASDPVGLGAAEPGRRLRGGRPILSPRRRSCSRSPSRDLSPASPAPVPGASCSNWGFGSGCNVPMVLAYARSWLTHGQPRPMGEDPWRSTSCSDTRWREGRATCT